MRILKYYPKHLKILIGELSKLPGIGGKTAQRLAFHILSMDELESEKLAKSIIDAKKNVANCSECGNLTEKDPCYICDDHSRNKEILCVVESSKDIISMEKVRDYNGKYHVLHGLLSPIDGRGPEDINLKSLIVRLQESSIKEVIVATNPTVEGEATAMYIARLIKPSGIKVSRIAHGIPVGGDLEFTDEITLLKAIEGRKEIWYYKY